MQLAQAVAEAEAVALVAAADSVGWELRRAVLGWS
jgi:hypothetical protein